jgi:hypothetical protein
MQLVLHRNSSLFSVSCVVLHGRGGLTGFGEGSFGPGLKPLLGWGEVRGLKPRANPIALRASETRRARFSGVCHG